MKITKVIALLTATLVSMACKEAVKNNPRARVVPGTGNVQPVETSRTALDILAKRCSSCHNETNASGGFGFVTDVDQMLASGKYLVAGDPEQSLIFTRSAAAGDEAMPPPAGLDAGEHEVLGEWIRTLNDPLGLRAEAQALLENKCAACHNPTKGDGGFNYVTDVERMISSNKYINLADVENSLIYTRTDAASAGVMPPGSPVSAEERGMLLQWLKTLKSDEKEYRLSDADYFKLIKSDLDKNVAAAAAPGVRYFTLHHLKVARAGETRLEAARQAFMKTINSLSMANNVVQATPIDPDKLIYRLTLSDINMPVQTFEAFMTSFSPYSVDFATLQAGRPLDATFAQIAQTMNSKMFSIRMDWFVATATMPIPYQRLLRLPLTLAELRTQFGVNAERNINDNTAMRSGFGNSGVSANNRVIERHLSTANRFFWESYDFLNNDGIHNIFNRPLGPVTQPFTPPGNTLFPPVAFTQDGGEMIFQLPNGFLGFYLTNGAGNYIHKGPLNVVRNKNGPENFLLSIVNGFSCMDCHKSGILDKADQIRAFAAASDDFSVEAADKIMKLYADPQVMTTAVNKDSGVFQTALKTAGLNPTPQEDPVKTTLLHFYDKVSLADAAADLGANPSEVLALLSATPFREDWAQLALPGGTLLRDQFNRYFGLAKEAIRRGSDYIVPTEGDFLVTTACIQANPLLMDACVSRNFGGLETPPPPPAAAGQ